MPSASNGKPEKAASSEAPETPVRQIMTIIEHKIRNLEKRKSKLTSYRDLQKSGKDLNADQKIAVAKYDEVAQTLEFARDFSKQVTSIALVAERDAKKQAKKDAWIRNAADASKIREVLLILDCLSQMGNQEARENFLNGSNGAARITAEDLKALDELYPEVTPKHEINAEGVSGFNGQVAKAAEHLCAIIDGKPKEAFGTTYTHIKEIITSINECGYFDKGPEIPEPEPVSELVEEVVPAAPEQQQMPSPTMSPHMYPIPPAAAVVPAPAYPLRPVPAMTLQEIEHAYFTQQYPQQRPITEVIGTHDFYFLQDSELDSPIGTPQPPPVIPTQTFTNQHYVPMEPPIHMPPHFAPHPSHPPPEYIPLAPAPPLQPPSLPLHLTAPPPPPATIPIDSPRRSEPDTPVTEVEEDWKENCSPEGDNNDDKSKEQVQGDAKRRFRRFGRGPSNSYRGRGNFHNRQNNDCYQNRQNNDGYQSRQSNDGYQSRQNNDGYQNRQNNDGYQNRQNNDGYQNRQNNDGYQNRQNNDGHQSRQNNDGYQSRQNNDSHQSRQNNDGHQNRQNNDGHQNRQNNDGYQSRQNNDGYQNRHNDYRSNKDGYQGRQYNDSYQNRQKDGYQNRNDNYYGNGDAGHQQENGGSRSRFESGYRARAPRARGAPRGRPHFARKAPAAETAD